MEYLNGMGAAGREQIWGNWNSRYYIRIICRSQFNAHTHTNWVCGIFPTYIYPPHPSPCIYCGVLEEYVIEIPIYFTFLLLRGFLGIQFGADNTINIVNKFHEE